MPLDALWEECGLFAASTDSGRASAQLSTFLCRSCVKLAVQGASSPWTVRRNAAMTTPRGCAQALHQSGIPFKASNSTCLVVPRQLFFLSPLWSRTWSLCQEHTAQTRGEHWQVLLAQQNATCLRGLSTPEGTVWTEASVFPPTGGSCTAAAAAPLRPHPVVLKVTRAVAVLRDGGAWPVADPAPAQLLPFRRCRGVCAPKTCSLHVCVTFHCGDVPTFYAKFFFSGLCSTG